MKKNLSKITIALAVLVITNLNVNAQVTIGSLDEPEKGMLLELKNKVATADNETVDANGGGLGLPRIKLISKTTLEPFIVNNADFQSNKDKVKDRHTGMVVYNLSTVNDFEQGLYVWDGAKWSKVQGDKGGERYLYLPSCNIKLEEGKSGQFKIYEEYKKQFSKSDSEWFYSNNASIANIPSNKSAGIYELEDLDYVITYYDKRVMEIEKIQDGVLYYKAKNLDSFDENSFINIVLVVK
jgi:hypothetical protein